MSDETHIYVARTEGTILINEREGDLGGIHTL